MKKTKPSTALEISGFLKSSFLLILLLASCSPQRRLSRLLALHPELKTLIAAHPALARFIKQP